MFKKLGYTLFLFVSMLIAYGQNELVYANENFSELLPRKSYPNNIGQIYNLPQNYAHPDFGRLPYDAPIGKNVVEQLHKRTATERYYIDRDNPTFFYIQKSIAELNYFNNGNWLAIDPTLEYRGDQFYEAPLQPYPTSLDFLNKKANVVCGTHTLSSGNIKLRIVHPNNTFTTLLPNWSNYTVGNNGAMVTDIFPGIDLKFIMQVSGIKTNYIIKSPIANAKHLVFIDSINLSSGLSLSQQSGFPGQLFVDGINVNDNNQSTKFVISKALTYDASGNRGHFTNNQYRIFGNLLELHLDSAFLNINQVVYPITIDPLITAVGPIAAPANAIGSRLTPAFCSQALTLSFPGGSTPWDFSCNWQTASTSCCSPPFFSCVNSDPRIEILSSCGGKSPAGVGLFWACVGCNTPGTWSPNLPFNASGNQSLIQCLPASCSSQNITFTLNLLRVFCSDNNGCNCTYATNTCVRLNNWSVTLQGRTLETLGNTTTGNGTSTISVTCFNTAVLNPTAQYGVSPYSYLWSPNGETTSTITYTANFVGSTTYTVTVTDACGSISTAVFTVNNNCVLPITLKNYFASFNGKNVDIFWETATERNSDYFAIEKSTDGINYSLLTTVKAAGNSSSLKKYTATDNTPEKGTVIYYRLRQYDFNNDTPAFEHVISISIEEKDINLLLMPNPTNKLLDVLLTGTTKGIPISIEIFDFTGKSKLHEVFESNDKTFRQSVNLENLQKGIYNVKVNYNGNIYTSKVIKN